MAYSTIKPKLGFCPECNTGKQTRLISGKCQSHYWASQRKKKEEKITAEEDLLQTLRAAEMNFWFSQRIDEMIGRCQECGGNTRKSVYKFAKCSVSHIFAKSENSGFPSIRTHPLNWMELCATNGCHTKAEDAEKATKMKCWPEMLRRIRILIPAIAPEEKRRIPEVWLKAIINEAV